MSAQQLHIPTDPKEQRAWLKRCSDWIKPLVGKSTPYKSINHFLTTKYQHQLEVENLLTQPQWAEHGYQPKDGLHGLPIWGRQRKTKSKECPRGYTFFPIDHVFHEHEVEPIPQKKASLQTVSSQSSPPSQ